MPYTTQDASNLSYLVTLKTIQETLKRDTPLEESLNALLKILARDMEYVRAFMVIMDPKTENLKLSLTYSPTQIADVTYSPGRGVIGRVFDSGQSISIPRLSDDQEFLNKAFGRSEEELKKLGFICVPVINRRAEEEEVIGALSVDVPLIPAEDMDAHRQFLEVVAGIIAGHVAQLQEEMAAQNHMLTQGMMAGGMDAAPPKDFVAASKAMRLVLRQSRQVAPSRATALLRGESGTGKELLAEAIHSSSPRADKPLIKLNCAALPSELIESELFGHQKGAFTGAFQTKRGLFEVADQGTLFLDEIGELPWMHRQRCCAPSRKRKSSAWAANRRSPSMSASSAPHTSRLRNCSKGQIPRGPVLSHQRLPDLHPAAQGAPRGHPAAGRTFPRRVLRRVRQGSETHLHARHRTAGHVPLAR